MATGFVWHELYMWHNTWNWAQVFPPGLTVQPGEHAENPETKRRMRNLIEIERAAQAARRRSRRAPPRVGRSRASTTGRTSIT